MWQKSNKPWQKSNKPWHYKNRNSMNINGYSNTNHKTTIKMSYAYTLMSSGATHACARYVHFWKLMYSLNSPSTSFC